MEQTSIDDIKRIIREREARGEIVFLNFEGFCAMSIDEIIKQPTEGLLYDLNRDKVTIMTMLKGVEDRSWINNYAMTLVIERLKQFYDLYMEDHKDEGCHAGQDGDCEWKGCPQNKQNEPANSGRSCPLWKHDEEE